MAAFDHFLHVAEEERQDQRADVRAVDVGVRHDDDLVVAELLDGEVVAADARAEGSDHQADLVGGEHLVEARLLHVENLSLQRKNRLEAPVAALLRGAAG